MPRQVGGYVRVGPRQTWAYSGSFTLLQGHHAKPVWMGDGLEGGQAGASAGMQWASVRATYSTMLKPGPDYGWADIWGYQHGIPESAEAEELWEELLARELSAPDGFYVVHYVYEVWASVGFELPDLTPNPTQILSLSYAAASFAFDYEHYGGEEDGSFWLVAPQDMALSWSVSVTNVALKRAWGTNVPDKRAHMHPRDAFLTDAWALTPESVATATIGGNTATATRRDAWTSDETDGEIGDELIDGPYVNYGCSQIGHASEGAEVARISVSGVDFSGLNNTTEVYPGGSWDSKVLAVGSGGGMALVAQEATNATHSWGGQTFAPLMYSWDVSADLFHGEALTPVWWAGKIEDGQPVPGLPSGVEPPQHGWQGTPIGGSTPPASPRGFNRGISIGLDNEWCLQQRLCPQSEVEYLEGLAIEEQHDRYVNLYGPGVQQGTTGGAVRIGSLSATAKSCLPLVPGRAGNPERRWSLQGEIAETEASTRALPEFLVEGACELGYQPVTRMWDRLALLPQADDSDPPIPKDWAWPWRLRAQAAGKGLVSDPADPREPAWAEDVFHWGALAFVKLQLRRKLVDPPPDWEEEEPPDWDEATPPLTGKLVLAYSTIEVEDQHYTCGEWRAEEWDYTRSPATAEYTFTIGAEESVVNIDLLCPDFGDPPRLYVVDDVRIVELDAGEAPVTMRLAALELVRDPGVDHTGRAAPPAPAMLASVKETWDFLPADGGTDQNRTGDWQGMSVAVDGNLRALEWPGDPWKNRGPERGRGYIEPLQHCPTYTGPAGLMHFARPIGDLGAAAQCEGIGATVDDTVLVRSTGADGEFEYLGGRVMYWGANQGWLNPYDDGSKGGLLASVNVTSHEIVRGIAYTICGRKSLGGAAWGLLRGEDGRKRVIHGGPEASALQWIIWKRVTAYQDADGDPIAAPAGAPALGQWEAVANGPLNDRLDQHGVVRTPGLPPSRSRVWNPARGPNPADHTDTATTEYLMQLWYGVGSPWEDWDLNDGPGYLAMLDDPRLASQDIFSVSTRRVSPLRLSLSSLAIPAEHQPGNLCRLRCLTEMLCRGGKLWTRKGMRKPWVARRGTTSLAPMVFSVRRHDYVALLDNGMYWSPRHGHDGWQAGFPPGLGEYVGEFAAIKRLTDARMSQLDHVAVAVGTRPLEDGVEVVAMGRDAEIAVLQGFGEEAMGGLPVYPWVRRWYGGDWRAGAIVNGTIYQWNGGLVGADWELEKTWSMGPDYAVSNSICWRQINFGLVVVGYHPGSGTMRFFRQSGKSGWEGPYANLPAPPALPYVIEEPTGAIEIGWLENGTWVQWRSRHFREHWERIYYD